jgi:uncharacterized protein
MPITMYRATVPVFARALRNLIAILKKGEASAFARKIDDSVLLNYRLAPDMFPLSRQVQIATDMAKGCVSRLAGVEIPSYEDKEATFGELVARLEKCIAYLESFTPAQIDGTEDKTIVLKRPTGDVSYPGLQYALEYVTPNVYFHCTSAYAILRHCGVDVGKKDFIGAL